MSPPKLRPTTVMSAPRSMASWTARLAQPSSLACSFRYISSWIHRLLLPGASTKPHLRYSLFSQLTKMLTSTVASSVPSGRVPLRGLIKDHLSGPQKMSYGFPASPARRTRCGNRLREGISVAESAAEGGQAPEKAQESASEGLSAFAAKVLNQLTLSAWLPAAVFAAATTLLIQFRSSRSLNVGTALTAITKDRAKILILLIPVLILTTMLTQAFSFAAIRGLEGYWGRRGPLAWLRTGMIRRHARRRDRLERRRKNAAKRAFDGVRTDLLADKDLSFDIVAALELQAVGEPVPRLCRAADQAKFDQMSWRDTCKPWDLAKYDQLDRQLNEYPELPTRTMPTKLGNVLRRTEDSLTHADHDVQGFAMRRLDSASARVRRQHDQFRDRLDMYCMLVFISLVIAIVSAAMLRDRVRVYQTASLVVGFTLFACVCYGSAIESARGYSVALKEMDMAAAEPDSKPKEGSPKATEEDAAPDQAATTSGPSPCHVSCRRAAARRFGRRGK
jgi:hypothetical protein